MLKSFYSLLCCEDNKSTIVKPAKTHGRLIETQTSTPIFRPCSNRIDLVQTGWQPII